ncbi:MAG: hypothetical protein EZS28_006974 [Streblomastix strix]|uniref:Cullin N-terminal domain-containing protein n=1 Tax=Streblomastix strix TaxID=222440 RepID=A0A5J4WQX3_9EUKA|nr:MAG: hypothetical protein EZS28_006974 [Streblomastix strix]
MAAQQVVRKQRSAHNNGFEEFGYKNLQPTVNFDFNQAWIFLEHTLNLIFDGEISVLQCEQVHGAIYRCGLHTIYNLGLQQFREIICPELGVTDKGQIVENVLDIIQKERNGEIVDTSDLKFFIQMLNELDIESNQFYNEIFENQFLEISTDYYRNESKHLSSMTTLNYINLIDKRLDQEQIRCDSCLNAETAQKILNIVINQMIFQKGQQHNSIHQNINILLGSERGALKMLFDDNYEGIAHLYRVFSAVSLRTNQLVQTFSRFIEEECNRINNIDINDIEIEDDNVNIKVEESSAAFVEQFIQLKKKIERFLVQSFTSTSEEQDESTTSRIHDHKPDIQFEHAAIQALQRESKLLKYKLIKLR